MAKRKILIAGASGLVGNGALRHFSEQADGWDVVAVSRRLPEGVSKAKLLSVDLLDTERCREIFGQMSDITHVVYAAVNERPGLLPGWVDHTQMETNLTMLRNLFDPLEAAATDLQHVSLLQGTKAYGAHLGAIAIPARERSARHPHENFYWLQEDYLRAKQSGKRWHWTILRPQLVIGHAIGSNLNVLSALGVYAALGREARLPLSFPGGPPFVFEMVDVDLLARSMEWAATTAACENEIFNITNGDVFVWQEVWPTIAEALGMKAGPPRPLSLASEMPKRAQEWAAIVSKYHLKAPADMHAFVGESLSLADFSMGYGARNVSPLIVSTIKARQAGFHDCMDSEDMLRKWFRKFQDLRLLPPVA
jgi:nucleoside-diphosphate-sugar epimerase